MQPIIVGIDPGTTAAFGVLSFDFKVIKLKSKKNYSLAHLIKDIYEYGNPIIVGTDKKEIPKFIKDFSQKTGAVIYHPKYDTKKGEKKALVKENGFSDKVQNTHEIDALASAIFAYNDYSSLINKISKYIKSHNKLDIKHKILIEVITKNKSISSAVADIERKPVQKTEKAETHTITKKKELSREVKEIALLKKTVRKLENKIKALNNKKPKKIDIDKETKKIISFKEQRALNLEKINRTLREELKQKGKIIRKLNKFIDRVNEGVLVKKLDTLGMRDYKKIKVKKNDILLVKDISIISQDVIKDIQNKVKIIIYRNGHNKSLDEFVLIAQDNVLIETENFALINKEELNNQVIKVLQSQKKSKDFIKKVLEEYKRERLKDII